MISLTALIVLLSGGYLCAKYWFRVSSHVCGSHDQVSNYQFINKNPASSRFLKSCQSSISTGLHSVLRIFSTAALSFSQWSFLNLQFFMIYFRTFLYDVRYFPYLDTKLIAWQKNTVYPWYRPGPDTHPVNRRLFQSECFMSIIN